MKKLLAALVSIALLTIVTIEGVWTYYQGKYNHMSQTDLADAFDARIAKIKAGESMSDMCADARQALRIIERIENKNQQLWNIQNTVERAVRSSDCN